MAEYDSQALSGAMDTFKRCLRSTEAGATVCEILEHRSIHISMLMDLFTWSFPNELRGDFELILKAPYSDAIQEAVSHVRPNVKLRSRDFETDIEHEVLFKHEGEEIQIRRTPENIRDI